MDDHVEGAELYEIPNYLFIATTRSASRLCHCITEGRCVCVLLIYLTSILYIDAGSSFSAQEFVIILRKNDDL